MEFLGLSLSRSPRPEGRTVGQERRPPLGNVAKAPACGGPGLGAVVRAVRREAPGEPTPETAAPHLSLGTGGEGPSVHLPHEAHGLCNSDTL